MRSTVLFVPGLRGRVAEHWQTLLAESLPGSRTVAPLEENGVSCAARVAALDAAIRQIEGPIILAAHSAGVMIVVHWAQRLDRPIQGALLATPPDIEAPLPPGYPTLDELMSNNWLPIPRRILPFPTILATSTNDPLASQARTEAMARDWGSKVVDLGAVGHLNPASGFGPWPGALPLIDALD